MKPARFPPGEMVMAGRPFGEGLFEEIDRMLAQGYCPDGRLELETEDQRLTCLIHRSLPYLAGLQEGEVFSAVPLKDYPVRARQMLGSICSMQRSDPVQVLALAVHFRHRPALQASTELVDIEHVLNVLAKEGQDAVLALERAGRRSLLFLQKGQPVRLFFGDPAEDPKEGDLRERFLICALAPGAALARVEAFKKLSIEPDLDAGRTLVQLAQAAKPPPPAVILVRLGGRVVLQRPFMPPAITIGRDHTCELLLDNLSVSRRHARLSWDRGQFVIEDLNSANGITLNGKVVSRAPVGGADRIGLGKFELALGELPETATADATMHVAPKGEVQAYLVGASISIPLTQEITLGKAAGVDAATPGWFIKPIHARIRQEGPGAFRLTCVPKAHVHLNGRRIDSAFVRPGDEIRVGRTSFKVVQNLAAETTKA